MKEILLTIIMILALTVGYGCNKMEEEKVMMEDDVGIMEDGKGMMEDDEGKMEEGKEIVE